jgi:hypothetical protein
MASKRALNAKNLEALGASALAELLIEVSGGNALIQRRLRLALAAAEGVDGAAQEVRKRLAAINRATTYVDARKRKALISDLEAQLQAIAGPIAEAAPQQACDLLLRFLELSEGVLDRCSDGTGAVIGVFERAAQQLGPLAQAAQLEAETLAEHTAELLAENTHKQFDALVPALKDALGDWGLRLLEAYCRQRGAVDGHPDLVQIALARGDMEAYMAQFSAEELSWCDVAAEVAGQLLSAGQAERALAILDAATQDRDDPLDTAWIDARIASLDALGRGAEAQQERWDWFSATLSIPHLREHLNRLDAFEDVAVEERALELAEHHPDSLQALEFLVEWPALTRAARHVLLHEDEWEGDAEEIHANAAERLSADHPLAATLLLRSLVFFGVWMGRAQRYRQAADHLRSCEQLAARIDDWQGHPDHHAYVDRLYDVFDGRWGFWKLVN